MISNFIQFHSDKQSAAHCDKRAVFARSPRRFWGTPGRNSAHSGGLDDLSIDSENGVMWSQAYIDGLRLSDGGEYAG